MASLLRMPTPAAGVDSALLLEWSVDEGSPFVRDDVLAVIETDKAVIEMEAEADGTILRRLLSAGRQVEVGTPIAVIGSGDEPESAIAELIAAAGVKAENGANIPIATVPEVPVGSETTAAGPGSIPGPAPRLVPSSSALRPDNGARYDGVLHGDLPADPATATPVFASPLARRLAKGAGLSLGQLTGTGPGGRIVRRDVQGAIDAAREGGPVPRVSTPVSPTVAESAPSLRGQTAPSSADFTDIPHSRVRTAIARRLTQSKQTIPHFYVHGAPRMDAFLSLRSRLNIENDQKISVNDLIIKAVALAHRAVPEMNVIFADTAIRQFHSVDIAIAIATDGGLVTPVIRGVDRLSVSQIAAATADLAARARAGRLFQSELEGGSITISNLGMFGVRAFDAIINPPQSAILAVGATRREPVVVDDELVVGSVMYASLSVDHRPLDGVTAARWMGAFTDLMEHPLRILM